MIEKGLQVASRSLQALFYVSDTQSNAAGRLCFQ